MEREDHLEEWANAARDAIDAGRLDEAERLADRVLARYPAVPDGHELRGRIRDKQKRWAEAATAYGKALSVIEAMGPGAVDREVLDYFRGLRDAAQRKVR